jgi:hypothetical protein
MDGTAPAQISAEDVDGVACDGSYVCDCQDCQQARRECVSRGVRPRVLSMGAYAQTPSKRP